MPWWWQDSPQAGIRAAWPKYIDQQAIREYTWESGIIAYRSEILIAVVGFVPSLRVPAAQCFRLFLPCLKTVALVAAVKPEFRSNFGWRYSSKPGSLRSYDRVVCACCHEESASVVVDLCLEVGEKLWSLLLRSAVSVSCRPAIKVVCDYVKRDARCSSTRERSKKSRRTG